MVARVGRRGRAIDLAPLARYIAPLALTLAALAAAPTRARAQAERSQLALAVELDRAVRKHLESETIPGVSVGVVRGDETLLFRGYGYVDLEWDVRTPMDASASYEIGSVTKQFTAAAVLLLAEEGLIDLDADLTDYVDFDTRGRTVTVRRLLDHTSGIKGYTEMPVFEVLTPFELPRDSLVRLVERPAVRVRARHGADLQQHGLLPPRPRHRGRLGPVVRGFRARAPLRAGEDEPLVLLRRARGP